MRNFSTKDLYALYELDLHARSSLNKIARKLKKSQQGLQYTIEQLEEKKVILQYYTLIDYTCLGYSGYKILFSVSHTKKEQEEQFLRTLKQHPSFLSLSKLNGNYDYIALFAEKNASRCLRHIHILTTQFPQVIQHYILFANAGSYELKRRYLGNHTHASSTILGGDREKITLPPLEMKILQDISDNPKISYVQLATKYKVHPKTIIARVKGLETKGVIKGYSITVDCTKYHYSAHKLFLKVTSLTKQKDEDFMKFFRQQEHIIRVSKILGQWDYEIDIEIPSLQSLYVLSLALRTEFGDVLQHMEMYPLLEHYTKSTVPKTFFLDFK